MRTLSELFEYYYAVHALPHKRSHEADLYLWEKYWLPEYGAMSPEEFRPLLPRIHAERGVQLGKGIANATSILICTMYKICELEPPRFKRFPYIPRERVLSQAEMDRLLKATDKCTETFGDFVKMLMFTGARSGNVRAMTWKQVDRKEHLWTIPSGNAKSKRVMYVPLIKQASEVLDRRWEMYKRRRHVFPQRKKGKVVDKPMARPNRNWERLLVRAKIEEHATLHDVRRSVASWMSRKGVDIRVISQLLGHSDISITAKVYSHLNTTVTREALELLYG